MSQKYIVGPEVLQDSIDIRRCQGRVVAQVQLAKIAEVVEALDERFYASCVEPDELRKLD